MNCFKFQRIWRASVWLKNLIAVLLCARATTYWLIKCLLINLKPPNNASGGPRQNNGAGRASFGRNSTSIEKELYSAIFGGLCQCNG